MTGSGTTITTITNGEILSIILIVLVVLIRYLTKYIREYYIRRTSYTRNELQDMRMKAHENGMKSRDLAEGFLASKEYFQILVFQQWENKDRKFLKKAVSFCELQAANAYVMEYEWNCLRDFIDIGLETMENYRYARPDINIKRRFDRTYRRCVKIGKLLVALRKAESALRFRYGYLFLLPVCSKESVHE